MLLVFVFFFKQKTAYEMRISDWSSDVCSSDLAQHFEIVEKPVPVIEAGQILVRNAYLSVEPAMRGWIADVGNYAAPVALGSVMRSLAAGTELGRASCRERVCQ